MMRWMKIELQRDWLNITSNSSHFLLKIYISGAWIKEDLIYDPMEKSWGKKEF